MGCYTVQICGNCHSTVVHCTDMWQLPQHCGTLYRYVATATALWYTLQICGNCHSTVVHCTDMWQLPQHCGTLYRDVTTATALWYTVQISARDPAISSHSFRLIVI